MNVELSVLKQQVAEDFKEVSQHINRLYEVMDKQFELIQVLDSRIDYLMSELKIMKEGRPASPTGVEL